MRFWDASAIVPLLVDETASDAARALYDTDPGITVWWATDVECVSAIARRERLGTDPEQAAESLRRLSDLESRWQSVAPTRGVKSNARRILRSHDVRAADGLQLGAALTAADGHPETLPFVTLDDRLALAARREGFPVLGF